MAIVLTVLGFMWWWPLGLLILGFLIARGRFGYWRHRIYAGDGPMLDLEHGRDRWERKMARMQEKMERMRARMDASGAAATGSVRPRAATAPSTIIARRR